MKQFPAVPPLLLDALSKAFPDKAPRNPNMTPGEVGVLVGQQQVIDFLRAQVTRHNPLKDTP